MGNFTVLFDACVLYPAPLRDLLMHLAVTDLFRAKWTEAIHDEWIRNLLARRPDLKPEQLQRTRMLMNAHVRDCLVTDYESEIENLSLPDPNDRHVLAAAIHAGADLILTTNLKDFPEVPLSQYGIQAIHPDEFLASQLDVAPNLFCLAVKRHRTSLKHPPKTAEEYLQTLESQGLHQTVTKLRTFVELI